MQSVKYLYIDNVKPLTTLKYQSHNIKVCLLFDVIFTSGLVYLFHFTELQYIIKVVYC